MDTLRNLTISVLPFYKNLVKKIRRPETWTNIGNVNAFGKQRVKKRTIWLEDFARIFYRKVEKLSDIHACSVPAQTSL